MKRWLGDKGKREAMNNKQGSEWFFWVKLSLIAITCAVVVRGFLFSPIVVDGPSMQPTLHDRDHMIVNKFIYHVSEPKRFDVVIFHASDEKDFIKRVIGLPGEHVAVKDNQLYINDEKVNQDFLKTEDVEDLTNHKETEDFRLEELPGAYQEIPDGYILVLGDNRTNSTDSRVFGLVSMDQVVGKTSIIYWPLNRLDVLKNRSDEV